MITGSVQEKKGFLFLVINLVDTHGQRRQKWISTGLPEKGNKREANRLLAEKIQEYQAGEVEFTKEIPFHEWIAKWLENMKDSVRPNTYDLYCTQVNRSIIPYFKEHPVSLQRIGVKELNGYYHFKLKTCSPKTVKKHRSNIQLALEAARLEKLIPYNPNSDIKIPTANQKPFVPKYYDVDTVARLLEASRGDVLEAVIFLTATYGFRRSEVLGLEWGAIDFIKNTISVFKTAVITTNGTLYQERTKNKTSRRVLPMSPEIREYLLKLYNHQQQMKELFGNTYIANDLICKRDNGDPIKPDFVSRHFVEILKANNLPQIRFHDLRHSAATILINMGYTMKEVSEWLGHSDISTTMNIYAHVMDKTKVAMAAGLSASILGKIDLEKEVC